MQALGENPTTLEIQKMITKMDWDKDGQLNFDEFVCMVVI